MPIIPDITPSQGSWKPSAPDPDIAARPGLALGSLGQSIAQISEPFLELAKKNQRFADTSDEYEIRSSWNTADTKLQSQLQKEQDPNKRLQLTDDMITKLKGELGSQKVSPSVKQRTELQFTEWADGTRKRAAADAIRLTMGRAQQGFKNEWGEALRLNDRAAADRAIGTAKTNGLFTPEEETAYYQDFERNASVSKVGSIIEADPHVAKAMLESPEFLKNTPGFTEADQLRAKNLTESKIQELQKDALKTLTEDIESKGIQTEEQLVERLKVDTDIDKEFHDEVIFHFRQSQPLDAETRFAIADDLNALHTAYANGEMSLTDYRDAHDTVAQIVYSFGSRDGSGALREKVHALDPARWNEGKLQATAKQETMREVEKIGQLYQTQGAFGAVDEEDGEPAVRAEKSVGIMAFRERVEKRMSDWVGKNPEASGDDLRKQFRKTYMDEFSGSIVAPEAKSVEARRDALKGITGGDKGAHDGTPDKPIGGNLKTLVKQFEAGGEKLGYHPQAYWDKGQWSIGYGTKSTQGEMIDQAEAERRLDTELAMHRKRVVGYAARVGMKLEPHEEDALTSFDYNTGSLEQLMAGGTRSKAEIASKMLLYRNAKDDTTGVKVLLKGLIRRRMAEATLFRRSYQSAEAEVAQ